MVSGRRVFGSYSFERQQQLLNKTFCLLVNSFVWSLVPSAAPTITTAADDEKIFERSHRHTQALSL